MENAATMSISSRAGADKTGHGASGSCDFVKRASDLSMKRFVIPAPMFSHERREARLGRF
jgi:hypothetical protein